MKISVVIGDKELESWEAPDDSKVSDVLVITMANPELRKVTMLRFTKVGETSEGPIFDLDSAFSMGQEHLDSVKRIQFE